jgi:hypothetical protein
MTVRTNIFHDGIEVVAAHLSASIRRQGGIHHLAVRPNGAVRLYARAKFPDTELNNLVGTYNPRVTVEVLEDDLLQHIRDRTA